MVRNPLFKVSIYKIACGALHTVVITTEGEAYTFGCNDKGALGRPGRESIPIRVELDEPVDMASAGDHHSVFASSSTGNIFFVGSYKNLKGQTIFSEELPLTKYNVNDIDSSQSPLRQKKLVKIVSGANHIGIIIDKKIYMRGVNDYGIKGKR